MDCSELILLLLKDSNLLVALNSSWALGNLADTLDKNKLVLLCFYCVCVRVLYLFIKKNCCLRLFESRDSLLEELPTGFLVGLIEAAINASQGPIKVLT